MIFLWCQAARNNLDEPFNFILGRFNTNAERYYTKRIVRALERADELFPIEKQTMYDIAARVCLNMTILELPPLWSISGLFIESVDNTGARFYVCVCPSVYRAFIRKLLDTGSQIISVLVIVDMFIL